LEIEDACRIGIVFCTRCTDTMVAYQDITLEGMGVRVFSDGQRLWPSPEITPSEQIPKIVRDSLTEARRCFSSGVYTASVAMTGRAIEGLCHHFKTKKTMLFEGLKELLAREVIDKRLYQWAEELRKHRNLAAHASGATFTRQDAEDILEFAVSICDYVFVMSQKFEEFTRRTGEAGNTKTEAPER
jgi:hypothetical protein